MQGEESRTLGTCPDISRVGHVAPREACGRAPGCAGRPLVLTRNQPAPARTKAISWRPPPCSSIRKGVPLYGWKNRGEAPRRWLLSEPGLAGFGSIRGGPQAQPSAPPQASLGATCPTLEIPGQVPSVVDSSPCKRKASLPPGGPRIFPWATLTSSLPPPLRPSAQEGPGDLRVCLPLASVPRSVWGAREGGTHAQGRVLQGGHRLGPAWTAWGLALAQTVPTCTEGANLDRAACTLYNLA